MRERRRRQIVVSQRRENLIDQVGPSCEIGPDHLGRTFRPDEAGRPRQVEPPLQIGAASRPQAKVSVLADDLHRDVLVGNVREGDQSLPAAPTGRLRGFRTGDVSHHRVQTIRTDQQIALRAAAVSELDSHPVLRADRSDHARIAPDAIGRKAFHQALKKDSTWDHPNGPVQPVHDGGHVDIHQLATSRCRDPHGGQQLSRPVHIDSQLLQNRRAIGPDGHRTTAGPHIRPPLEDGDVMSVSQ